MNMQTFVCNKNPEHYFSRLSDEETKRESCMSCDGWMYPAPKASSVIPFQLWCLIGGWKPVCVKHRRIFMFSKRYYRDHGECESNKYPYSDLAIRSGFMKVWLP